MKLPKNLLAEIAWRSDPATLLRLAATCKPLHGSLSDPEFLRCYRLGAARSRRPVFVGAFVWQPAPPFFGGEADLSFVPSPAPGAHALSSAIRSNLAQGHGYTPAMVASRGGLVVLFNSDDEADDVVRVWNPVTGRTWDFLSPAVISGEPLELDILLDRCDTDEEAPAEPSFRLLSVTLAMKGRQRVLCAQTLSRDEGAWGPLVATPDPGPSGGRCAVVDASPLVLGATAHWLCCWSPKAKPTAQSGCRYYVLSYDVDAARAAALYVPPDCFRDGGGGGVRPPEDLLLASSPAVDGGDRLSLLVARGLEIRVWTLCGDGKAELAHRVEIDAARMTREMEFPPLRCGEVELMQFVETAGVLVLQVPGLGVLAMDLFQTAWTNQQEKMPSSSSSSREVLKLTDDRHMYLHDINLRTFSDVYVVPYVAMCHR